MSAPTEKHTHPCRRCERVDVVGVDLCQPCYRAEARDAEWRAGVAAPRCPCGKPLLRCDECGVMHCNAPGHLLHKCEVANVG